MWLDMFNHIFKIKTNYYITIKLKWQREKTMKQVQKQIVRKAIEANVFIALIDVTVHCKTKNRINT